MKIVIKHQLLSLLFSIFLIGQFLEAGAQTKEKPGDWETLKMVNTKPTEIKDFAAAFPIGNGRIGVKVFGGVANETLCLNETTLWSGMPAHYEDPAVKAILGQVRAALANAQYKKADSLSRWMHGKNNQAYQPLGNLNLSFPVTEYSDYSNTLIYLKSASPKY